MADLLSRRTKSSCSRKGSQFQSCIWCIILKCFIYLPCIFSKCLDVDISVAVYPQGDRNIEYGDPLELFCVADNSSSDIQFTLASKTLESEIVNSTTRRLYIKKPEKQVNAYYCQNIKKNKICTSRVLVDSSPSDVTDFNCLSKNLDTLNCSWTSPPSFSSVNYNVTFSINNNLVTPACVAKKVEQTSTRYCVWNTTSQPRYRQQEDEQFLYLVASNIFGRNSQNFTIDHFAIVKPGRPSNLQVIKNGTHSVLLTWNIPNNMVDLLSCGVEHIIEYHIAKVDNRTYFRKVDTSHLPPKNESYRFHLTDLPYAHMHYEVRIYIKSKKAVKRQYWSEYEYVVFTTLDEIPKRPPDVIAGAFDQSIYDSKRVINVYWKQVEECEEAGSNFTYKVLVSQANRTQIVFPDKNKSMSYVSLNATNDALDVTVWSFNINGSSINSSHLYIPSEKDTQSLNVPSFTKLAYENGTYELTWVGIKNIDNYTLFWCQHNITEVCIGRMDFAVLNPTKTSHIIDLPREFRYQFAISANNGSKTSGMAWAKCDISKVGFIMYRFEVNLKYDAPTKSSVTLRWGMECALQDGIIIGYNITYCPIIQTSSYCDKSVENKYVYIPNAKQMDVTIKNLLPFRTYQFTLSLNTTYGLKNVENATVVVTTLEDTPSSPINVEIFAIRYDSLVISWDPPIHRNGNIGKYVIWNFDQELYVDKVSGTDTSKRKITLKNIQAFSNYSLSVQACNIPIGLCSKRGQNDNIVVRTSIGPPSRLKAPTVKNNPDILKWEQPDSPGGGIDLYQIRRVKDDLEPEILNTTKLSYSLTHCEGVVSTETYEVRAVNFDNDTNHGARGAGNVTLPKRPANDTRIEYPGPWSEPSTVACRNKDGLAMISTFLGVFVLIGVVYGSIKMYKKYRKMEDIKPVLPNGLGIPEKDISKYTFSNWNPTTKDEKPPSDEMLLLPNSKPTVSVPDTKQEDENSDVRNHTDSTALSSDSSIQGSIDREAPTSDDGSNSSFIEVEQTKETEDNVNQEEEDSSANDTESLPENSPYFSDKNPVSGYDPPVVNPATGYVQSAPAPIINSPSKIPMQPTTTSYVMAGLPPSVFTTSTTSPITNLPQPTSGYVLPEEAQARSMMNFPKFGPTPKFLGPENLPTMPTLPAPTKHSTDNSYIQLQSLDSLPSLKSSASNPVPLKPPASSGYVSPADVVMNKHLNNMIAGQHAEESAILDPAMSPEAYCRFSWSTDPANDNLQTLLAESPTRATKN